MLVTIAVISCLLWLIGIVTSYTMGGLIHILLMVALAAVIVRVLDGRRMIDARR